MPAPIALIVYGSVAAAILVAPLFIAWGLRMRTQYASIAYISTAFIGILGGLIPLTVNGFENVFGPTSVYSPIGLSSSKGLVLFFVWLTAFPTLIFSWLHFMVAQTYPRTVSNRK
jgi:hypothetical protein